MNQQTTARIFIAGNRCLDETDAFRSYSTFQCEADKAVQQEPFGDLYFLSDDTLAPGQTLKFLVEEDSIILLLPTVGGVICRATGDEMEWEVDVGECATLALKAGSSFYYRNPFQTDLVNLLQYRVKEKVPENKTGITNFSVDEQKNNLLPIASPFTKTNAFIGKFDGRFDSSYQPSNPESPLFVTVLEGAFEVQNRLLETRDSLGLEHVEALEFEALSNNALIIVMELPAKIDF